MNRRIGFIGAGNIGTAMITSIVRSGFAAASEIYAADRNQDKLEQLHKHSGIHICSDNTELIKNAEVVVIAVKPQIVRNVAEEIRENFGDRMLITIAAGVPMKVFEDILGCDRRIFRAMPNLPLLVGEGMTVIASRAGAFAEDMDYCKAFFRIFGKVEEMDESLLSTVISLTASSPAYVFMMIEAMTASFVKAGVPVHLATRIVSQIILGSAGLFPEMPSDLDLSGCDIQIKNAIAEAIAACNNRAWELEKL